MGLKQELDRLTGKIGAAEEILNTYEIKLPCTMGLGIIPGNYLAFEKVGERWRICFAEKPVHDCSAEIKILVAENLDKFMEMYKARQDQALERARRIP